MDRKDIINFFVEKNKAENYLEIGVFQGYTLGGCVAKNKTGVDPFSRYDEGVIKKTSDDFFAELFPGIKYDIIFIDGLHEAEQVYRDIENAVNHITPGGVIIIHDCNPPLYEHTTTGIDGNWTGDVYKAIIKYRRNNYGTICYTVDTDWGVGVIKPGQYTEEIHFSEIPEESSWEFFDTHRKTLINLISIDQFLQKEK